MTTDDAKIELAQIYLAEAKRLRRYDLPEAAIMVRSLEAASEMLLENVRRRQSNELQTSSNHLL
ncbi:hypothetical protein [Alicyclobacillus macrosporangiidus]|uniref:Uncharacterized protein n=1 Tax=Alicyclobacillus macrosporangiidus TaxID=392015 RepID=A0A1I7J9W3_9BACL|nr:hypothetical protein [Alicyclobacillus macrosporangiidus]SFU82006.1 hypothetical protein SAMN05421543_10937 [Alicyclobacillus macrosporangiidus]